VGNRYGISSFIIDGYVTKAYIEIASNTDSVMEPIIYLLKFPITYILIEVAYTVISRSRRGRDRMVVGFTTTCAISAYYH
jgi:hypothetical protein